MYELRWHAFELAVCVVSFERCGFYVRTRCPWPPRGQAPWVDGWSTSEDRGRLYCRCQFRLNCTTVSDFGVYITNEQTQIKKQTEQALLLIKHVGATSDSPFAVVASADSVRCTVGIYCRQRVNTVSGRCYHCLRHDWRWPGLWESRVMTDRLERASVRVLGGPVLLAAGARWACWRVLRRLLFTLRKSGPRRWRTCQ